MEQEQIESILLANWYLIKCKMESKSHKCDKTELARKYLVSKIRKALSERTFVKSDKAFFIF
jgi:hypothetical protein